MDRAALKNARLAEALKANLRRRKEQARARHVQSDHPQNDRKPDSESDA